MNITSIYVKEKRTDREAFAESIYADTAFGKLLLGLESALWTKKLKASFTITHDDSGQKVVYFFLNHDLIMNTKCNHSVQVPCTLEEVPEVADVASLVTTAFIQGIEARKAVKLMLELQIAQAELIVTQIQGALKKSAAEVAHGEEAEGV